jgi:RNA polymerase sigma-70 factor (ECF subfamily)
VRPTEPIASLLDHREDFVAFLRRRLPVQADVDDVLQQALMTAVRSAGAVRSEPALVPWFYVVLRSTVADHFRRRAREARAAEQLLPEPTSELPPHEVGSCACSVALLDQLPPEYAEILTRVDVREEPVAAVATELGLTLNNATVRLHRARKALRERVAECCGCTSSRECSSCGCATGCA